MAERNYGFRSRLLEVHKKGMRDDSVWPRYQGLVVTETFDIVFPNEADEVGRYAAYDLMEYFRDSMGMYLRVRAADDIAAEIARPAGKIILTDGTRTPSLMPSSDQKMANRIVVTGEGVIVCGRTGRGTAQGSYELESRMNACCGPVLEPGEWDRAPLFSPRMTHSGFGQDMFPDEHLRAIAHAGMDAIMIFCKDVDRTPHGYLDFNDVITRAAKYGLDTYAYSYLISERHPDDEDAEAHYESTYGRLFDRCPGFKGVIMVGESCEFPSKDPHVVPYNHLILREHPELNPEHKPAPGWYPCQDYPDWINLVRRVIQKRRPDIDFVFWTYNWGWADEEARLNLIRKLPTDVALQATYEMFEDFNLPDGVHARTTDYTLFFEGPGRYFTSEAQEAKKRGIRMHAMSNTAGATWDVGVVPYLPCPDQWRRRWDGLIEAHEKWGLVGLMECHSYGFWPSFISELAREHYWSPREEYDAMLRRIAVRDFTEAHADTAIRALSLFSEGIRHCISTDEDQYGPFRVGPAYPLLYQEMEYIPDVFYSQHGGNRICFPMYKYDLTKKRASFLWEIGELTKMRDLFAEGVALLRSFRADLTGRRLDDLNHLIALTEFIMRSAQTTLNTKNWFLRKWELLGGGDRERLIREMLEIGEAEIQNAEATIPLVEYDSRLGFEPSMEYMADRAHLEWKIAVTRKAMAALAEPPKEPSGSLTDIWED